ncbi:uncharacterized protein G2W53_035972 [Senna tora]|uniref:Uncharacterized protein n=1 Tax=Senna tora TaxID=362788 RepID=A0A834SSP1_9FABA|nr:uncharacterized protein G2W53_035972 [Senna tora]
MFEQRVNKEEAGNGKYWREEELRHSLAPLILKTQEPSNGKRKLRDEARIKIGVD